MRCAIEAWTAPFRQVKLPDDDLVHGDLGPENILLRHGRLSALINAETVGRGSRFHDAAALIVAASLWGGDPAASRDLRGYAARHAAPGELEVSVAACLLAVLAFQVERGREDLDSTLRVAGALLRELGAVSETRP